MWVRFDLEFFLQTGVVHTRIICKFEQTCLDRTDLSLTASKTEKYIDE